MWISAFIILMTPEIGGSIRAVLPNPQSPDRLNRVNARVLLGCARPRAQQREHGLGFRQNGYGWLLNIAVAGDGHAPSGWCALLKHPHQAQTFERKVWFDG